MTLADRIVILEGGRLQQVGTPQEVFDRPANRFVAGFVGSPGMRFLERLDPECVLGVRPHEVRLGRGELRARVEVVERLGSEAMVHLDLRGEALVARVDGPELAALPRPGDEVAVSFDRVCRFDRSTGVAC
jgi:ABC-type sugar transport system ATPase subunit